MYKTDAIKIIKIALLNTTETNLESKQSFNTKETTLDLTHMEQQTLMN